MLFDYGGVISQPPSPQEVASLAGAAGVSVAALAGVYWEWRRAYDLAELDASGYWRQVGRGLGRGFSEAKISELIRLDSAGPIIFRQKRLGLCGKPFTILKFRTMHVEIGRAHV